MSGPLSTLSLGLTAYSVEFSPWDPSLLVVGCSQHFGIIGTGQVVLVQSHTALQAGTRVLQRVTTADGVYDVCWSECDAQVVAVASGDGSVTLLTLSSAINNGLNATRPAQTKVREWREHRAEVYSVDWNGNNRTQVVSGSWDYTCKLWSPDTSHSLRTFREHTQCVYCVVWHPRHADLFASCAGDGLVKVWSSLEENSTLTITAHQHEVLSVDFNKYNEFELITGSVDRSVKGWDMRNTSKPLFQLDGHHFAVRRVKCSPHAPNVIASVSYDMSLILWDSGREDALLAKRDDHTEFVLGVDFSNFDDTLIATASWDETVRLYRIPIDIRRSRSDLQVSRKVLQSQ